MEEALTWFGTYEKHHFKDLEKLPARLTVLEADIFDNKEANQDNKTAIKTIRDEVNVLSSTLTLVDSCEVMMSGVPSQFSHDKIIDKVATALDLPSAS